MNTQYLKLNDNKFYLADVNGINAEENKLELNIKADSHTFENIKSSFSALDNVTIYSAIVQEDGRETDEIVHQYFDNFTKLDRVSYNMDADTYSITLVEPDLIDKRLTAVEEKVNEPVPLTSPFTSNAEPTGTASRYYEKGELIAVYDKNSNPFTVIVTNPISYGQSIMLDLNCEIYQGGK